MKELQMKKQAHSDSNMTKTTQLGSRKPGDWTKVAYSRAHIHSYDMDDLSVAKINSLLVDNHSEQQKWNSGQISLFSHSL